MPGTIPKMTHQNTEAMLMVKPRSNPCSTDGQANEIMSRTHEKAIGQIGIQRKGRCLPPGSSDICFATRAGIPVHRTVSSSIDRKPLRGGFIHLLLRA